MLSPHPRVLLTALSPLQLSGVSPGLATCYIYQPQLCLDSSSLVLSQSKATPRAQPLFFLFQPENSISRSLPPPCPLPRVFDPTKSAPAYPYFPGVPFLTPTPDPFLQTLVTRLKEQKHFPAAAQPGRFPQKQNNRNKKRRQRPVTSFHSFSLDPRFDFTG